MNKLRRLKENLLKNYSKTTYDNWAEGIGCMLIKNGLVSWVAVVVLERGRD